MADDRRRDFDESVSDARSVFEHLRATVRTVLDYDRFETGQLVPRHDRFLLAEAAVEILEELRRHAVMADKTVTLARPPVERALYGDRELLSAAMLNLGMAALRRIPTHGTLAIEIGETDVGMRFRMVAPGPPLQVTERIHAFEPYSRRAAGSATYGLGLALAQAVIGLHEGRIWVEELEGGKGCAFVFELGWQRSGPRPKRVVPTGPGEKSTDRSGRENPTWRRACWGGLQLVAPVLLFVLVLVARAQAGTTVKVEDLCRAVVEDPNYKVRVQAALVLGKLGDPTAVPALIKALADQNSTVRGIAAAALGQLGDASAGDPLRDLVKRESEGFVRSQATKALAALSGGGAGKRAKIYLSFGPFSGGV